jgi:four helix bundle protein
LAQGLQIHATEMSSPTLLQTRSFDFSVRMLSFHKQLTTTSVFPRALADQMLKAGTAIGANLAEALSAYSRRDLAAKQGIALKEARECHYWLRLLTTTRPDLTPETEPLIDECGQLIAMLTASVKKLRSTPL